MIELDRWLERLKHELELDPALVVDVAGLLDLARVAAHSVDRPAAPLTTYLVGYAAGRADATGSSVAVADFTARTTALAETWPAAGMAAG